MLAFYIMLGRDSSLYLDPGPPRGRGVRLYKIDISFQHSLSLFEKGRTRFANDTCVLLGKGFFSALHMLDFPPFFELLSNFLKSARRIVRVKVGKLGWKNSIL